MSDLDLQNPQIVIFNSTSALRPGDVELHSLKDSVMGRSLEVVKADFAKVHQQLQEILGSVKDVSSDYAVESISVSLGFSAKGQVVFIAEGGIEASITIEFKHKP